MFRERIQYGCCCCCFFRLLISLPVFHSMFWIWLCLFWFAYSILCAFSIFFSIFILNVHAYYYGHELQIRVSNGTFESLNEKKNQFQRVFQFAHQMNTISFHFIFSIRFICPRDKYANGYFWIEKLDQCLFVHATNDSICMHHSVTNRKFPCEWKRRMCVAVVISMHNRLKSLLPIANCCVSGWLAYIYKVRWLFPLSSMPPSLYKSLALSQLFARSQARFPLIFLLSFN